MAYKVYTSRHIRLGAVDPYQEKVNQLHDMIQAKAIELQSVTEEKDGMLREVKSLGEQKDRLLVQIHNLEKRKVVETSILSELVVSQKQSLGTFSKELKKKKRLIASAEGKLIALNMEINNKKIICQD